MCSIALAGISICVWWITPTILLVSVVLYLLLR